MTPETQELLDRTLRLAVDTIKYTHGLPRDAAGYTITRQLIRSASSVGANLREAQRARSKSEFLSKIQICLQEACESEYWIQVAKESDMGDRDCAMRLLKETGELIAIFAAITRTAKLRQSRA